MPTALYPCRPHETAALPERPVPVTTRLAAVRRRPGDWRYDGLPKPPRICWPAVLLSAGLHGLLLGEFSHRPSRPPPVAAPEEQIIQMVMPPLDEDEEKPVEELGDEAELDPGVAVPRLMDLPSTVELKDAFVQPLEMSVPLLNSIDASRLTSIPLKIAPAGQRPGGLKDVFTIAQLDRPPQPIVQPSPDFPQALKQTVSEALVVVEFIVDTKGETREIRVISSTHEGFDRSSIEGVSKWRFRPGMKGGRKVNTRMKVPIQFVVTEPEAT